MRIIAISFLIKIFIFGTQLFSIPGQALESSLARSAIHVRKLKDVTVDQKGMKFLPP